MSKEITAPNCVGFVYNELDIIPEEKYVKPPKFSEALKIFDQVDTIDKASVLVVVDYSEGDPFVSHIAIVCDNKTDIIHRKGIGAKIIREDLNTGLECYLENSRDEKIVMYFKPKTKRVR